MKRRPSEAIFADGRKPRPMALHPEAVNVSYPTLEAELVADVTDGIAVLCIDGPLEHRMTWWANYEALAVAFKACCEDPAVNAIMLKFDYPGGECAGLNETVALMQGMKAASGKPVIGYVDEACYSAAYALSTVCDELFLPASGGVGSIGVITAMIDETAALEEAGIRVEVITSGVKKADGHPCVALTDGAIKRTQQKVDDLAQAFFGIVADARGLSVDEVQAFEAGTFNGQDAVDAGLADGVMSLNECLTFAKNLFSYENVTPSTVTVSTGSVGTGAAGRPFSLPTNPTDRSVDQENVPMAGTIAAAKAAEDAKKAALAANAGPSASAPAAKVTKTKTVTTDTHETLEDDGEPEEAEVPEEEPKDDDEDAKATASIVTFARELTGKAKASHVVAALRGMAAQTSHAASLQSRLDKLEADAKSAKLNALIATGTKAGKLAPAQRAWALTQSPDSLKAFLDAAPAMVRSVEAPVVEPAEADALTPQEIAMCASANPPVDPVKYAATKAAIRARSGGKGV